jgi:hypothetical protein
MLDYDEEHDVYSYVVFINPERLKEMNEELGIRPQPGQQ